MTKRSVPFVMILAVAVLLSSCMIPPKDFVFSVPPVSHSFKPEIPLQLGLVLTDEFKNAIWVSDEHKINFHVGAVLSEKAKEATVAIFSDVLVAEHKQDFPPGTVNALLEPKLISYERTRPVFGTQTTVDTAVIQWTLTDMHDSLVWVDSVQVDGESSVTGGEATRAVLTMNPWKVGKLAADRGMEMMAVRFFNESVSAMQSSVEIRAFAKTVAATP